LGGGGDIKRWKRKWGWNLKEKWGKGKDKGTIEVRRVSKYKKANIKRKRRLQSTF
jgi:hypothetical protein